VHIMFPEYLTVSQSIFQAAFLYIFFSQSWPL